MAANDVNFSFSADTSQAENTFVGVLFAIDPVMGTQWEYEIQGNYGQGWEAVTRVDTPSDARSELSLYNENEPEYPHRIRKVKV